MEVKLLALLLQILNSIQLGVLPTRFNINMIIAKEFDTLIECQKV